MSRSRLFIGSSQGNLRVAKLLAEGLEESAEVTIWDEGVFGLNQGFLETLLKKLEDYDFAVFVLAPDDITISNDETKPSPRDNVLFESGLFMGILGRERVFLLYDQTMNLKIPSDLAGVTLASYDGSRLAGTDALAAVRRACRLITDSIMMSRFPHLIGEWKSIYPMTFERGCPIADEEVEIRPCRNGISITSKINRKDDYYGAFGRIPQERLILGEWKSRLDTSDVSKIFMLTVSPSANYMYGYFTSPDELGGVTYAGWVLAKKSTDETVTRTRLETAEDILRRTTIFLATAEVNP